MPLLLFLRCALRVCIGETDDVAVFIPLIYVASLFLFFSLCGRLSLVRVSASPYACNLLCLRTLGVGAFRGPTFTLRLLRDRRLILPPR